METDKELHMPEKGAGVHLAEVGTETDKGECPAVMPTELQAAPPDSKTRCSICFNDSENIRVCPGCKERVCVVCSSISNGLLNAALPFLNKEPPPTWQTLNCLGCEKVEDYDKALNECLDEVAGAVLSSLLHNNNLDKQTTLWYHVGLTFTEAGSSGSFLPDSFVDAAEKMLIHEVQVVKGRRKDQRPSVSPWDGMVSGISPELVLRISRAYARMHKIGAMGRLREVDCCKFVIVYISADLVDHSTAHLVTSELIEMSKMRSLAEVFVLCVAKPGRVDSMNPNSPYRSALMQSFGERFLNVGDKSDRKIADQLRSLNPHVVVQVGFHQNADRPGILNGAPRAVVVQYLAHAGPSGSTRVSFILGSEIALAKENEKHFSETRLIMEAPFHGNSFRQFFGHHADRLLKLRTDPDDRSAKRRMFGLQPDVKLLLNISFPNRLKRKFWDIIFRVLRANPHACLVLIDHVEAFKLRMQARFKTEGLENRLCFVPFQQLHDGSLHSLVAVCDVYVDNPGYNGHTALHDALWASSAVVSIEGKTLAERIGADLLTSFGTPENICKTDDAAVERINELLQKHEVYEEARFKAEQCRMTSAMYDSELRGRLIIAALKKAYECKLLEQRKSVNVGADDRFISSADLEHVREQLTGLCIDVTGPVTSDAHSLVLPAKFRGVDVDVVMGSQLNADFCNNVVIREAQARDFMSFEYGDIAWTRALPLNERVVKAHGENPTLDAISLTVRQQTAYAILLERPTSTAAGFFQSLAQEWSSCKGIPLDDLLGRTIIALRAMLLLLACVHGRARSYGGDPLDLHLSPLRDGHCKKAVANIVLSDGRPCAIMLGRATHMLDDALATHHHRPECRHNAMEEPVRGRRKHNVGSRVSARGVNKGASTPLDIQSMLASLPRLPPPDQNIDGMLSCCGGYACKRVAQRDDLRRAAQVIMNTVLGQSRQPTVVERSWAGFTGSKLYTMFLRTLDDNAFRSVTGLVDREDTSSSWKLLRKKTPKLAQLLDLLARMLGGAALEARALNKETLFDGIVVPSNALKQGLDSAPEDQRARLRTCVPLMTALSSNTQHYFVKGKTLTLGQGTSAETKKLIDVWLCYTINPQKRRPYRAVRAAEPGNIGDCAAIYSARVERDEASLKFLDICFLLRLPSTGDCPCIDGKDRGILDAPKHVEESIIGMYLNSTKDEKNMNSRIRNCGRLWDPEWKTFGSDKSVGTVSDDPRMLLTLIKKVEMYEELVYTYDWKKSEEKSGRGQGAAGILANLSRSGGNR